MQCNGTVRSGITAVSQQSKCPTMPAIKRGIPISVQIGMIRCSAGPIDYGVACHLPLRPYNGPVACIARIDAFGTLLSPTSVTIASQDHRIIFIETIS